MGVDLSRIASSAIEAALDDGERTKKRSGMRTLAAGAALAIAARAAASKAPGLMHMPSLSGLRDLPDRMRDRMADAGWLDDEQDVEDLEDEEPEAEAEEDFDEEDLEDEEPEDEDEEDEPEDEEEPEAEADEDFEAEEDEDFEDEEDEEDEEPPPELELESADDEELHPEDRPPKPPRSTAKSR